MNINIILGIYHCNFDFFFHFDHSKNLKNLYNALDIRFETFYLNINKYL